MNTFRLKSYYITTSKVEHPLRIHFISDLHGFSHEKSRMALEKTIDRRRPDLILVGGDSIVSGYPETWFPALEFIESLSWKYPLYQAYGNHEQKLTSSWRKARGQEPTMEGEQFLRELKKKGTLLDNESREIQLHGVSLVLHGLSLDQTYFQKPFPRKLTLEAMEQLMGKMEQDKKFHILLAHSPYHGDAYFQWGSDLTLCGHYHGGVWRFGRNQGLVSTYFHPFPRYCCGSFSRGNRRMIVSPGLGEHTVKVRIHNPRELIEVQLLPEK